MRQFVADCMPDEDGCILVTGSQFRHLHSVLRSNEGDMVYARLPDSSLVQMTVARVEEAKKCLLLSLAGGGAFTEPEAKPAEAVLKGRLWLFQFAARAPRMELILRQAVECGVTDFVPVEGSFCQGGNCESAKKRAEEFMAAQGRWHKIAGEAMEQSGAAFRLRVHPCVGINKAVELWSAESGEASFAAVLYERASGTVSMGQAVEAARSGGATDFCNAAVVVGAEGGISQEELKTLQGAGFIPVHFATNILRCETAALYGVAALQTALEEALCRSNA